MSSITVFTEHGVEYRQEYEASLISIEQDNVKLSEIRIINGKFHTVAYVEKVRKKWYKPQVYRICWLPFKNRQSYINEQTVEEVNILIAGMAELKLGLETWQNEIEEWKARQADHIKDLGLGMHNFQNSFDNREEKIEVLEKNIRTLDKKIKDLSIVVPRTR